MPGGSFIWCFSIARPFDSRRSSYLQTVRNLYDLRTVDIGLREISLKKSTSELDAPAEILRTVSDVALYGSRQLNNAQYSL